MPLILALLFCLFFVPHAFAVNWETNLEGPPAMGAGAIVRTNVCPEDANWPTAAEGAGKDIHVTLPKNRACHPKNNSDGKLMARLGGQSGNPARNIWVEGGWIENNNGQGGLTSDLGSALLDFQFWSGTVFVEGVRLDAKCTCEDIIHTGHAASTNARVVVQNAWIGKAAHCGAGGTHGDSFHAQGSGEQHELVMTNIMDDELAQGVFVPPRPPHTPSGHGVSRLELSHYWARRYTGCSNPGGGGIGWRVTWIEPNSSDSKAPAKGVYFNQVYFPGAPDLQYFSSPTVASWDANNCANYTDSRANIKSGKLCQGNPPNGSFIPTDRVGLTYDRSFFTGGGQGSAADLIPTDITWSPASPTAGGNVTFSAVVKNQGDLATAAGALVEVAFKLNGTTIAWSDNYSTAIAPGESATITANGGPDGDQFWVPPSAGDYTIEAAVDENNRIAESNETNNSMTKTVTAVAAGPALPVISVTAMDPVVERGTAGTKQRIKLTRTGDTSQPSTIHYSAAPSGSNPAGAGDFSPSGFPSGDVTFSGDGQ